PLTCRCITAYQNDEGQFWKVNYHWDLIHYMLGKGIALNIPAQYITQLKALKQQLLTNAPIPQHGYRTSLVEGQPHDASSHDQITKRWEMLSQIKLKFKAVLDATNIRTISPPAAAWDLAVAKVAKPGTSKHGKGFALDIEGAGQNQEIMRISKGLGATTTFNEASHVHVEFANGVLILPSPEPDYKLRPHQSMPGPNL
ncbi:MAG TPA: hypothetical protein VFJ47_02690, partial [Terriglobales bacterium]|nr:hypothetical protein [Terriglobales bacterium]